MFCKTCKFFKRGKWHKVIDPKESPQYGGKCELLKKVLEIENSELTYFDHLYVQDFFGCSLYEE